MMRLVSRLSSNFKSIQTLTERLVTHGIALRTVVLYVRSLESASSRTEGGIRAYIMTYQPERTEIREIIYFTLTLKTVAKRTVLLVDPPKYNK